MLGYTLPLNLIIKTGNKDHYKTFCNQPESSGMLCQQLLALASTESSGETEKFQTGGKPSADQAYSDQAANTALASQGHQKLTCGRYICNI